MIASLEMLLSTPSRKSLPRPETRRIYDAVRNLALLGVVCIHVSTAMSAQGTAAWRGHAINTAMRWSVPFFMMLSGALLLGKEESAVVFFRKRLQRLALPIAVFTLLYQVWDVAFLGRPFVLQVFLAGLVRGAPKYHLWFLYTIFGLYLAVPFLRVAARSLSRPAFATGGGLVLAFAGFTTGLWALSGDLSWRAPALAVLFSDVPLYVGYFVIGYVLRDLSLTEAQARWCGFASGVVIAGSVAGFLLADRFLGHDPAQGLFQCYLGYPVILAALPLFAWILHRLRQPGAAGVRRWLGHSWFAQLTLGIYLLHVAVLDLVMRYVGKPTGWFLPDLFLYLAVVLGGATLAAWLIQRVPGLRRIIG